jgi:hypothetical protein
MCVLVSVGVGDRQRFIRVRVSGKGDHACDWRDVYDIAVRWRQQSEPFDPVFYIDGMTPAAFAEGFGLQTPMVSGQQRVVRYHSEVCST